VNTSALRFALIAAGCLGSIAVVRLAAWPIAEVRLPPAADFVGTRRAVQPAQRISPDSVAAITAGDPFRIMRRPALPAYDPLRLAQQLARRRSVLPWCW